MLTLILTTLATASPGPLDDLGWLEGTWLQDKDGVVTTEQWVRPHPDVLLGLSTTVKDGKEVFREHLQIGRVDGVVSYTAWPQGSQRGTHFKLSSKSNSRVVFENPQHDFPKKISYWRTPGKLHARVEGGPQSEEWTFVSKETSLPKKALTRTASVAAPLKEVWKAWTTLEGAKTFFAPAGQIDLRPGGSYEMWFAPDQAPGMRGADDCRVIEFVKNKKLVITWNFPPSLPSIRNGHTVITLTFSAKSKKETTVHMSQIGWRDGPVWDKGFAYFEAAWTKVMSRLEQRFASGPIDWDKI